MTLHIESPLEFALCLENVEVLKRLLQHWVTDVGDHGFHMVLKVLEPCLVAHRSHVSDQPKQWIKPKDFARR